MKAIIISDNFTFANTINNSILAASILELVGCFPAGAQAMLAIQELAPELVLMDPKTAYELNETKTTFNTTATIPRVCLSASTHQGMQLLPVAAVYYFQAEHKYVVAHHAGGELLINDSLTSLAQEFTGFLRIHRKTLVAKGQITALEKTANGHWQILLANSDKKLIVSRRQLARVRESINACLGTCTK